MATTYQLITTAAELRAACEALARLDAVGFDCETTALDPYAGRLRLVQLAGPEGPAYLFDLDQFAPDGAAAEVESLEPLRQLLSAQRPVKIAHNAKFDAKWARRHLGVEVGGLFDTLLASQLVSAGETEDRHGLAVVAARYLDEDVDKTQQLSDWGGELSAAQLEYAARDAALMLPLRERLIERLKSDGLVRVAQIEFECVTAVAALELAGLYLDAACWREQIEKVKKERVILAEDLQAMLAEGSSQGSLFANARADINLDSHTQLSAALKRMGVPLPDSTRNWKLQPLAADYPVISKLLEYRTVQKSLTSYGENILEEINPVTGRIHASFHQIGAPTGRFACLAGDTLVPVPSGLKLMRDLREGDAVKTSYGFRRVEGAWPTGVKQLYRVRLRDGRSIRATADHRFLTGRADIWRRLDELRPGDTLFVSLRPTELGPSEGAPRIDAGGPEVRSRKAVRLPAELSPALCELMGLVIADGFLGRRHERPATRRGRVRGTPATYDRVTIACGWHDDELMERITEHGRHLFGQPFREVKSGTCRVLQLASTRIAHFLAALGLEGDAHTKSVPGLVLRAPATYQAAFLRGLFEGDGCRGEDFVSLTSVNLLLLARVQLMLSNLGIYSSVGRRADMSGFAGSDRYDLKVHGKTNLKRFMQAVGFISERKNRPFVFAAQITDGTRTPFVVPGARLYREAVAAGVTVASREGVKPFVNFYKGARIKDESVRKLTARFGMLPSLRPVSAYLDLQVRPVEIESITPDAVEEVYDITVEGVHEFVADGIVVHNCTNPNVQQIPHAVEYRRCVRAQGPGRKLIIADYSQIELRILAHVTEDKGFIEAFNSGADLHRVTAAQIFNTAEEGVTREQRDFAKRLNFGVVYGIGAQRFSMMTGLPLADAEQIMARYFQTYRGLDQWLRDAARKALRERSARTMAGRLARFNFDPEDRQAASLAQRNGKNMPVQGASADILKRALRLLHDRLRGTSGEIVNIVHDEIVAECDASEADAVARAVEESMCAAGAEFVTRVPVKVETEIADEWVK